MASFLSAVAVAFGFASEAPNTASGKSRLLKTEQLAGSSSIHKYEKGIYTIWEHVPAWADSIPGSSILRDLHSFQSSIPHVATLLRDLWGLGPLLCTTYLVANMLESVLPAIQLSQTARFLSLVRRYSNPLRITPLT